MGNSVADFKVASSNTRFRDRERAVVSDSDRSTYWSTGGQPNPTLYSSGSASRCVDVNHPSFYAFQRARARYRQLRGADVGHPFAMERVNLSMPSRIETQVKISDASTGRFSGVYAPSLSYKSAMQNVSAGRYPAIPTGLGIDRVALFGYGSTAIAKSLSNVPKFSLARFIGELREGLPKVPLTALASERKVRNVGGEYLNFQFGVAPTLSDVQKFIDLCMNPKLRESVRYQLHEEHRVRKTLDKGKTYSSRALTGTEMSTIPSSFSSGITGTVSTVTEFEIWSSCSFVYYQVQGLQRLLDELDHVMGTEISVNVSLLDYWNLIPWSWFVDWFTNINHVITNLSYLGRDGLYLQRGYIMGHYTDVETSRQSRTFMNTPIATTGVRTFERKYRVRASPFGFGYTWKDFNPFQLSILGALGVSRMNF